MRTADQLKEFRIARAKLRQQRVADALAKRPPRPVVTPRVRERPKPEAPVRYPKLEVIPYTGPVVRHLAYHIWPNAWKDGLVWKRNLDQLLARAHVFNGQRRMGISVDEKTHTADDVQRHVESILGPDHGFVFGVNRNIRQRGEYVSFDHLFGPLETRDPNAIIIYGHAKGVRHTDQKATVHRWTSAMIEVLLDGIDVVDRVLEDHVFAGSFLRKQRMGRASPHHYSGTWWATRAAYFYARDWRSCDRSFWGLEALPGRLSDYSECFSLFCEAPKSLYNESVMQGVEAQLEEWRAARAATSLSGGDLL